MCNIKNGCQTGCSWAPDAYPSFVEAEVGRTSAGHHKEEKQKRLRKDITKTLTFRSPAILKKGYFDLFLGPPLKTLTFRGKPRKPSIQKRVLGTPKTTKDLWATHSIVILKSPGSR